MANSSGHHQPGSSKGSGVPTRESYFSVEPSEIDMIVDLIRPGAGPEFRKLLTDNGLHIMSLEARCVGDWGKKKNVLQGRARFDDEEIRVVDVEPVESVRDKKVAELEKARNRWQENFWEESEKRKELEKKLKEDGKKREAMAKEIADLKSELQKRKEEEKKTMERFQRAKNAVKEITQVFGLANESGDLMETSRASTSGSDGVQAGGLPLNFSTATAASTQQPFPEEHSATGLQSDTMPLSGSSFDQVVIEGNKMLSAVTAPAIPGNSTHEATASPVLPSTSENLSPPQANPSSDGFQNPQSTSDLNARPAVALTTSQENVLLPDPTLIPTILLQSSTPVSSKITSSESSLLPSGSTSNVTLHKPKRPSALSSLNRKMRTSKRNASLSTQHRIDLTSVNHTCICGTIFLTPKSLQQHIQSLEALDSPRTSTHSFPDCPTVPLKRRRLTTTAPHRGKRSCTKNIKSFALKKLSKRNRRIAITSRGESSSDKSSTTSAFTKSSQGYRGTNNLRPLTNECLPSSTFTSGAAMQATPAPAQKTQCTAEKPMKMDVDDVAMGENKANTTEPAVLTRGAQQHGPSEWLYGVFPKSRRYFPQVNDALVYYSQAHHAYVAQVTSKGIHVSPDEIDKSSRCLRMSRKVLAQSVRLVSFKFEMIPPVRVTLKLEVQNWSTGSRTGEEFSVTLHDMPDLEEFLFLRQIYDECVQRRWCPGDKFRHLDDNKNWRLGTVDRIEEEQGFPGSVWKCYHITWDNGLQGKCSPWDMDEIPELFEIPGIGGELIPSTEEELRNLARYHPKPVDWPNYRDVDGQLAKLSGLIDQVIGGRNCEWTEPFYTDVDSNAVPSYYERIAYPMTLERIRARLRNGFYRRATSIKMDFRILAKNAATFYSPESTNACNAQLIRDVFLRFIRDPNVPDAASVCNRLRASRISKQKGNMLRTD